MWQGFLHMSYLNDVWIALIFTHITIVSVTVFLHRAMAHRSLTIHPILSHFFRFWLWLTTGMVTKEWVAIHRKHHACDDRGEDPHSPQIFGINEILWKGLKYYRIGTRNKEIIDKFGEGCPNDWIERTLYTPHTMLGYMIMLAVNMLCFGIPGILIWGVQMLWIPFFAAGVINGIGHYWGYRNFATPDASTNIVPWGILVGGEELHNNHHAFPKSAKLSARVWEFDVGWMYINIFRALGLAKVKHVLPKRLEQMEFCSKDVMRDLIRKKLYVFSLYRNHVVAPTIKSMSVDGVSKRESEAIDDVGFNMVG